MPIPTLDDLKAASDEALDALRIDVLTELERRRLLATAAADVAQINQRYVAAIGRVDGGDWVQPTGAHDAYTKDSKVLKDGKTYQSTIPANVWAPPGEGWREVVPAGAAPAAWVQPGSTNPYKIGDRVTFEGATYESLIDGNVWSPTAHPAGWKKL